MQHADGRAAQAACAFSVNLGASRVQNESGGPGGSRAPSCTTSACSIRLNSDPARQLRRAGGSARGGTREREMVRTLPSGAGLPPFDPMASCAPHVRDCTRRRLTLVIRRSRFTHVKFAKKLEPPLSPKPAPPGPTGPTPFLLNLKKAS